MDEFEHERKEKKSSAECKSINQAQVVDSIAVCVVQSQVQLSVSGLKCQNTI
jgi:hypothetical protein